VLTLGRASPVGKQTRDGAAPPAGRCSRSLSRVETEAGKEENGTRVHGGADHSMVLMCRESRVTVHRRWTARSLSGQIWPRWASKMRAQAFTALCDFTRGLGQTGISLRAGFRLSLLVKIFFKFSVFRNSSKSV
jgi:hypothetical protein